MEEKKCNPNWIWESWELRCQDLREKINELFLEMKKTLNMKEQNHNGTRSN